MFVPVLGAGMEGMNGTADTSPGVTGRMHRRLDFLLFKSAATVGREQICRPDD
jgi:hypothetical protein